jgi:hypothetical protein
MSRLTDRLGTFYKVPFEKLFEDMSHEDFIDLTIVDILALMSIRNGVDWKSLACYLMEANSDVEG